MDIISDLRKTYNLKLIKYNEIGKELASLLQQIVKLEQEQESKQDSNNNDSPKWMDKYLASHW